MTNNIEIYLISAIILTIILCRLNANRHKKNYAKFLTEFKGIESKNEAEINIIMKYISKHYEIQEMNQYIYISILLIALTVLFNNL